MARPPLPADQRRTRYVALRLTEAEAAPVQAVAADDPRPARRGPSRLRRSDTDRPRFCLTGTSRWVSVLHMTTKRPAPKFTAGQRVEVLRPDFEQPGFPEVWQAGTIDTAEWLEGCRLWDVKVLTDGGHWSLQRVGPRGGNKHIRVA